MQECVRERKENVLHAWDINGRNFNQINHLTAKSYNVQWENELGGTVCSISA